MQPQPEIDTPRLRLRAFDIADGPAVQRLAGSVEVAQTTLLIPHPYPDGAAEDWISSHAAEWRAQRQAIFAIMQKTDGAMIGSIGLNRNAMEPSVAELGYWIGYPYWNNGFCTEAARAVIAFGFESFNLCRITAHHFAENTASGCVMTKLGMHREGVLSKHVEKWGELKDIVLYGIAK